MGREKQFRIDLFPRDVLADVHDLDASSGFAYLKFWMHHALHGEPLPPRSVKKPPAEWDEWFRDLLGMKNVRTWRNARDELLRLGKIKRTDDGRYYIGRTMRDAEKRRGGDPSKWSSEGDGQGALDLQGVHWAQVRPGIPQQDVEKPVEEQGQFVQSAEVPPKFGRTSRDVTPIWLPNSLEYRNSQCVSSYSKSKSHEVVAAVIPTAARARGSPHRARA